MRSRPGRWRWLAAAAVLALPTPAPALIQLMYPLSRVIEESTNINVGRVVSVDAKGRTAVVVVEKALKGKGEYKRINMNIGLGPAHHAKFVMARLADKGAALVFYQRQGANIACLVHAGDVWFQLFATDDPKRREKVWWRFTHVELHMPRTFSGSTAQLIAVTQDVIAKKRAAPKPDPKAKSVDVRDFRRPQPTPAARAAEVVKGKAGGFHRQAHFRQPAGGEIRGVSFADVNGDGLADVYFCRQRGNVLLVNQGGGLKEMTRQMKLTAGSRSASWADYNGDDHPDLLTNNFQLFTNVGGAFRDDSSLLPRVRGGRNPEGAGWIDYNGDGRVDILITNGEHGIRLFENTGRKSERFRDVSAKAGLGPKGLGVGNGDFVCFMDYDADGYADFFYNLGKGVLARNDGKRFTLDRASRLELPEPDYKRGLAAADFDNDGDVDLFVPAARRPRLYRNNNDGTFTDVFPATGDPPKEEDACFAAAWGDVDGDGHLDLFVCHTSGSARLYLGDGKGRFRDVSDAAGVRGLSPCYGAGFADLDDDGDLDLAVNGQDRVVVAYNEMPRAKGYLPATVRVQARVRGVGAVARALDEQGRLLALRELNGAESCGGQAAPVAHFALPLRPCRISVALSDGRLAQKTVRPDPKAGHLSLVLRDADFK
jgi:hypothetical protein